MWRITFDLSAMSRQLYARPSPARKVALSALWGLRLERSSRIRETVSDVRRYGDADRERGAVREDAGNVDGSPMRIADMLDDR